MKKIMLLILVVCGAFVNTKAQDIDSGDHKIGVGQAADLIWKYMKLYPDNAKKCGWADFDLTHFPDYNIEIKDIAANHYGQYFYFLYDIATGKFDLATEYTSTLTSVTLKNPNSHTADAADKIKHFSDQEGFFDNAIFSGTYINFIQRFIGHTVARANVINRELPYSDVDYQSANFPKQFKPEDNVYPRGFYHSRQFYDLVHVPGCKGIRIYWGYDGSEKAKDARIHIVAVPYDINGKNINDPANADALILEQSGPLDPLAAPVKH